MILLSSWLPTLLHLGLLLLLLLCLLGVQEMIISVKRTGSYTVLFLFSFYTISTDFFFRSLGVFLANMIFHLTTWGFFLEDILFTNESQSIKA